MDIQTANMQEEKNSSRNLNLNQTMLIVTNIPFSRRESARGRNVLKKNIISVS